MKYEAFIAKRLVDLRPAFLKEGELFDIRPSLLAGICWAESAFGWSLLDDCGDWTLRRRSRYGPRAEEELRLRTVVRPVGRWVWPKDAVGTMCCPVDALGWGRGLMQLDWCAFDMRVIAWRNPDVNMHLGAQHLRGKRDWLSSRLDREGLEKAAIAAYNAGEHRVLAEVLAGGDPNNSTWERKYVPRVLAFEEKVRNAWK